MKTVTNLTGHRLLVPQELIPLPEGAVDPSYGKVAVDKLIALKYLDPDGSGPYLNPDQSVEVDETVGVNKNMLQQMKRTYGTPDNVAEVAHARISIT